LNSSTFYIYNASAGSGKTFTLVKEYLKLLIQSPYDNAYKYILALTFTNKAVGEMKTRIIETLKDFSKSDTTPNSMFQVICDELKIGPKELQQKSEALLKNIVHNYAAFDISTLDKFTQKLIRTFAYDLKLPLNFEVELDTDILLSKAVDNLIARAGHNKELTQALIDFAIEKADDDKSWDIAYDFKEIAKLLINENHVNALETLKDKQLSDFKTLKKLLNTKINTLNTTIKDTAQQVIDSIQSNGLEFSDFSRSYLPNFFIKIASGNLEVSFSPKWQLELTEGQTLYPKKVSSETAAIIDGLQPTIAEKFNHIKSTIGQLKFLKNFYKNTTPLSVINAINQELNLLKEEQNLLLISEFNTIVSEHIKAQPAPFIYERIGEKFKHYFIDEFQDTSVMQWENLIPLMDNALSGANASSLIVGDAKQAIYRWRGGKAEQFIDLYNHTTHPFQVKAETKQLAYNYRSYEHIVSFNNSFFKHLSTFVFSNPVYQALYNQSWQQPFITKKGYVDISFLELENTNTEDRDLYYAQKVLDTIHNCLDQGFHKQDICVLVRKKKEGIAIANFLTALDIDIISSETLLIQNAPEVQCIINIIKIVLDPKDYQAKVEVLSFLLEQHIDSEDQHQFFKDFIHLPLQEFFNQLSTYGFYFNSNECIQLPIYEAIELIIYSFNLAKTSNAYIQFFLDVVLDYSQKHHASLVGFLNYYEEKKDNLSIVSPEGQDAIQIMTIHKSKGLEFPVVIFPFADLDIYREKNPHIWLPIDKDDFHGFDVSYINYNADLELINAQGAALYHQHRAELELDNINLLYVALTRPIEQLYIISSHNLDHKGNERLNLYSGLLINYLKSEGLWKTGQLEYAIGTPKKESSRDLLKQSIEQDSFISFPKKQHNINIIANSGYIWDSSQEDAIEKGNLIHFILSHIKSHADIDATFATLLDKGFISQEQFEPLHTTITAVIDHPQLIAYFDHHLTIYNERDIITDRGEIIRPDRLVFLDTNTVVLIDYKTGAHHQKYIQQLAHYQNIIETMSLKVVKKILIYINDTIEIKEV
jgi:ATP-dependent exoDNAse (exonuclease V) beta subunit